MEFNELWIPPPRYWQQFEDLCLSIFRQVWGDPIAQKNGRSGQPQHGTDIWGTHNDAYVGVQCKGKDAGFGATLSERELREEAAKARSFNPRLSLWILATTARKDAHLEEVARQITVEHQATDLFKVRALGWEDIVSLMTQFPSVIEQHYPDLAPNTRIALARISKALDKPSPDLTEAMHAARDAAKRDLEKFQNAAGGHKSVHLNLEKGSQNGRLPISHSDVRVALRSGQKLLLEAEPGAGKSVTLTQLAASVLSESHDCAAVIILLPELGAMRRHLIDHIAIRDAFRGIAHDALSQIAQAGRLVFVCDGWNELSTQDREWVRITLASFQRDFPGSGLLFATRTLSPSPVHEPVRIFLLPTSRAQQLAILSETLGPGAEELLTRARRTPGLRDLLQTPLYVAVLADIGSSGTLPPTKEEAIRRFIERQERRPEHSSALRDELANCHRDYLAAVAQRLTAIGAGAISQSNLRAEIARTSSGLKDQSQFGTPPEHQRVIDILVSHHVLVERPGEAAKPFYSFQHQQFREWFASFHVEERIAVASENPSAENVQLLDNLLNQPDWTEAIFFAVERLSRSSPAGARVVGNAICRSIGIDPMLGAAMIRRASAETWAHIDEPVVRFATVWHRTEESHRAFRFMTGSGRPEFAEQVWETIKAKEGYDRSANFDFGWFALSVLGTNKHSEYAKLPHDQRRSLLWDIMHFGGQEGIDFATEACRSEPSLEVVRTVLEILQFEGAESEFAALLQTAPPEVWTLLAARCRLAHADGEFRARLLEEKKKLAAASSGRDKLRVLLELTEQREYDNPEGIIALALETEHTDYHAEYATFTPLASIYPDQLSRSIVERILRGDALPIFAVRFVGVATAEHQESLRAIALGNGPGDGRAKEAAARTLNTESAQSLIQDLFAVLDEITANGGPAASSLRQKYQAITEALHLAHHTVLVASLLTCGAREPRHIAALAELLFRWRSDDSDDRDDESLPLDEATLGELSRALEQWAATIIGNSKTTRNDLSTLATAIKRVAAPSLLPTLKRLLDADLEGWHREQAELARLRREGRRTTVVNVGYTAIYRQAIEAFQGEAVRELLLTYIGNPDFEVEAAFALRQYGTSDRIPSPAESIGRLRYEQVSPARHRRSRERRPVNAVASAILNRIDALLKTGRPEDFGRAIGMATAAAQMEYGERVGAIKAVLSTLGPMSPRFGLLTVLVFAGEFISAAYVLQGFDEALSNYLAQRWHTRNEWWDIERWIQLVVFSDTPELVIGCVAQLPDELKRVHNFDQIVYALRHAEPGQAIKTLIALADQISGLAATHDYINACAQIGSTDAARHLLSLASSPPTGVSPDRDWFGLANVLPGILNKHPEIRRELLRRVATDHGLTASPVIARVLPSIVDQQDILALFRAWDPHGSDGASHILEQAVHDLAVEDRPIEGTTTFEREPSDLSILRAELLAIYVQDATRAAFAARLLRIIDRQRDVYGRPLSEFRHPNLGLGVPWPKEAASLFYLSRDCEQTGKA